MFGYRRMMARGALLVLGVLVSVSVRGADAKTALEVFREVRVWTDGWQVPDGARVWLGDDTSGVCVTLRYEGVVMGRGVRMRGDDEALAEAAREAMNEAAYALPVSRDATQHDQLVVLSAMVSVDVQLATALTPVVGETVLEATREFSPGRDGVAARVGQKILAVFGGTMLGSNRMPAESLRSVLSELGLPLESLGELRQSRGVIVYRFGSVHVAQIAAGEPAVFLHRGGRVRTLRDVNVRGLQQFAEVLRAHLVGRIDKDGNDGLRGTYEPWTGRYEDVKPEELYAQALAALALTRWSRVRVQQGMSDGGLPAASVWVLEQMATHERDVLASVSASAMYVIAARELALVDAELSETVRELRGSCLEVVRSSFDPDEGFAASLRAAERAMVCLALVETPEGEDAVRMLLRQTAPTEMTTVMPWLGWAEIVLTGEQEKIGAGTALRSMREMIWRHQLNEIRLPALDRDLAGGIVFTSSSNPLPTAQLLRPLAMVATMLGDRRLTSDDELAVELTRLMRSMRFVQQLLPGEAESHMYVQKEWMVWGVRNSLWDQRMRLENAGMGLLVVSEMLESVFERTGGVPGANSDADD